MDERTDGISRRQLSILLFVSALSPLIRQTPGMAVQSAGSAIWLSALLALVPLLWYLVMANHAYDHAFFTYRNLTVTFLAAMCACGYATRARS